MRNNAAECERELVRAGWLIPVLAFAGSLAYAAALPPIGWAGLAWAALTPWSLLIATPRRLTRHEWVWIWLAAWGVWLGVLHFIPIPHPALWLFWPLLAAYCAAYVIFFLIGARWLLFRWRVPLWLAVPVCWAGVEWVRGNFLTGFAMAFLSHSQYRQPLVIQVAELGGAYLLSFLLAMCGALVAQGILIERRLRRIPRTPKRLGDRRRLVATIAAIAGLFFGICLYGAWATGSMRAQLTKGQLRELKERSEQQSELNAIVVQGAIDTTFPETAEELAAVFDRQFRQYRELTIAARQAYPGAELVIWPETIFVQSLLLPAELERVADEQQRDLLERARREFSLCYQSSLGVLPLGDEGEPACSECLPLLTGVGVHDLETGESFNSVALIGESCEVVSRYDKIHRVIVGEYLPLGDWFPWIYQLTPVGRGIAQGRDAVAMELEGVRLCPSICFESTVPHLIRRQIVELAAAGREPDVLVNSTNDGWFFGTSCLDLHLACNVFRAVELSKPMVVAANTGFSAWIDERGRILEQGPRRATGYFQVSLQQGEGKVSGYRMIGDWPWLVCGLVVVSGLLGSWRWPVADLGTVHLRTEETAE